MANPLPAPAGRRGGNHERARVRTERSRPDEDSRDEHETRKAGLHFTVGAHVLHPQASVVDVREAAVLLGSYLFALGTCMQNVGCT